MSSVTKKTTSKKKTTVYIDEVPRIRKEAQYRSFRLSKKIKIDKLPSSKRLFIDAVKILAKNWQLFGLIIVVYGILYMSLVQLVASAVDINELKATVSDALGGSANSVYGVVSILGVLFVTGTKSPDQTGILYQTILAVIFSMAIIWTLRQVYNEKYKPNELGLRDSMYRSSYPLVPFILVLLVIAVQMLPVIIMSWLYAQLRDGAILVSFAEHAMFVTLVFLSMILSAYFIVTSLIAMYGVTLPNMTPMRALRASKKLVAHRRFAVMYRVVAFPIIGSIVAIIILVPAILWIPWLVQPLFFLLNMSSLAVFHAYMYNLYRRLM